MRDGWSNTAFFARILEHRMAELAVSPTYESYRDKS